MDCPLSVFGVFTLTIFSVVYNSPTLPNSQWFHSCLGFVRVEGGRKKKC